MKNLFDVTQLSQFEFGAILITVLIAGLVFGCLLAYALLQRKFNPKAEAAAATKEEFEEYKDKVDEHFNKTSEMFKDVTTQYKKLYDHMALGAIELSKADTVTMPRLEMQEIQDSEIPADQDTGDKDPEDTDRSADASIVHPEDRVNETIDPSETVSREAVQDEAEQDNHPDESTEKKTASPK